MPYHAEWFILHRVIEARFWGKVDLADLDVHGARLVEMSTEAQLHAPGKLVYRIMDMEDATSLPTMYLMAPRAVPVLRLKNRGPVFLITANPSIRSMMEISAHILNFKMHTFQTREEALQALEAVMMDETLSSR